MTHPEQRAEISYLNGKKSFPGKGNMYENSHMGESTLSSSN